MVQLRIVSGRESGSVHLIQRFPAILGRASSADVVLGERGIWDQHAVLALDPVAGFQLKAFPNALMSVNGQRTDKSRLRNGDVIEMGSVQLQFWLSEPSQKNFRLREVLTWVGLGFLCAAQIALIYWLLR